MRTFRTIVKTGMFQGHTGFLLTKSTFVLKGLRQYPSCAHPGFIISISDLLLQDDTSEAHQLRYHQSE
jgi:hypothetical protein